jgi:hypothetical protein
MFDLWNLKFEVNPRQICATLIVFYLKCNIFSIPHFPFLVNLDKKLNMPFDQQKFQP